jgi:uncharacterized protein YdaT
MWSQRTPRAKEGKVSASLHVCGLAEITATQPDLAKKAKQWEEKAELHRVRDLEEERVEQRRSQCKFF